ncbi:MAG TPA: alpha-L-arabinofuranosidase C-terminal domain-containing protein [Abditibacteriaceae bacterium]|nr:alpha-L-arabinofuranosidase C-terminal domain-containing protein [Abditibacteriaceae bacterium]
MPAATISVCLNEPIAVINPNLYGHFMEHLGTCVDEGIWVGEHSPIPHLGGIRRDVIDALRKLNPPVLRWPGGCFADDYHWEDGIGPRETRPRRVNIWWGDALENNHFGTHEFVQLCRLIGAQPYLCGNVGSGSPREMRDWVEYCNYDGDSTLAARRAGNGSPAPFGVRYWGVGNEAWGCGGNFDPEDYAIEYKRFATYLRDFSGTQLHLIACGPHGDNPDWTRRFFTKLSGLPHIHSFSAHYYTWNREGQMGSATEYSIDQWYQLIHESLRMEPLITQHRAVMDDFDPDRKISLIVDEWGAWHPHEGRDPRSIWWQQNTLRDAVLAATNLDIFNRHADKVTMTNIAQMMNVLQSMILTNGDRILTTPTYHIFDMYQSHAGGQSLRAFFEAEPISFQSRASTEQQLFGLSGSASRKDGVLTLSVVNPNATEPVEASIELRGGACSGVSVTVLADADIHAHNTFDAPDALQPQTSTLDVSGEWRHTFPPASVTVLRARVTG